MRFSLMKWLASFGLFLALIIPMGAVTPSYAGDLFAFTPTDHDRRCLINLQNADSIYVSVLQKQIAGLPDHCRAKCPFRNISQSFFVSRMKGVLKKNCLMHVTAAQTLALPVPGGGSGAAGGKQGGKNVVYIYQDGTGDIVAVHQDGSGNWSFSYQDGDGNVITVHQSGDNNTAGIAQFGNGNSLNLTQNGNNNTFVGVQTNGDSLTFTQNGGQKDVSVQ
jgi:hypothetical protein